MEWVKHCRFLGTGEHLSGQEQAQRDKLGVYKGVTSNLWGEEGDGSSVLVSSWRSQVESSVNISAVQTRGRDGPVIQARSGDCEFISSFILQVLVFTCIPKHSVQLGKQEKSKTSMLSSKLQLKSLLQNLFPWWMLNDGHMDYSYARCHSQRREKGKSNPFFCFPNWAELIWKLLRVNK